MDHPIAGDVISLDDVPHRQTVKKLVYLEAAMKLNSSTDLLEIVTWLGNLVRVSLSPAPVTRGVLPSGNLLEGRRPLVMCLNRVSCSSSWSEIID